MPPKVNAPVDPVTTTPPTQPTIPTIADLLPAKARAWIYAALGVWVPVFGAWVGTGEPPAATGWITAALGGAGFGVAIANVPRRTT